MAPEAGSGELITLDEAPTVPPRHGRWVSVAAVLALLAVFGIARLARHDPGPHGRPALDPVTAAWPQSANQVSASCTEDQVDRIVRAFVAAANAEDRSALKTLVAAEGQGFISYAQDQAVTRSQLDAYLALRHAEHEVITLRSLDFMGYSGLVVSFRFQLGRQADDIGSTVEVGTGAATCAAGASPRIADWVVTGS